MNLILPFGLFALPNSLLAEAPMQSVFFKEHQFFIKRDDLLNPYFSGNKARKFAYYLDNDFPHINTIVSYGSIQANSLYSLAALAKLKHWRLDYYVNNIPTWLKNQPIGNYQGALALGANIIEVESLENNLDHFMQTKSLNLAEDVLFIPEGGRSQAAKHGIKQLAHEIMLFSQQNSLVHPKIMLPSGTGTTALFLQSFLPFEVLTCACVGSEAYLRKQFEQLESNTSHWPTILPNIKKYHFGKLYPEFYQIWQDLNQETTIEFDMLYDPLGWQTLLAYLDETQNQSDIIYLHQGGLLGNKSMLARYQRKYD